MLSYVKPSRIIQQAGGADSGVQRFAKGITTHAVRPNHTMYDTQLASRREMPPAFKAVRYWLIASRKIDFQKNPTSGHGASQGNENHSDD